jgi:hypothetical protein
MLIGRLPLIEWIHPFILVVVAAAAVAAVVAMVVVVDRRKNGGVGVVLDVALGFARGFNGRVNFTDVLAQMSDPNDGDSGGGQGRGGGRDSRDGGRGGLGNGRVSGRVNSSRDRNPRMYPNGNIPVAQGVTTPPRREEHRLVPFRTSAAAAVALSATLVVVLNMATVHPIHPFVLSGKKKCMSYLMVTTMRCSNCG